MKKIFVILVVLLVSSLVFAGGAQWWKCYSVLNSKPVTCTVCAINLSWAAYEAGAAGLCGYDTYSPEFIACSNRGHCVKTHRPCVP